MATKTKRVPKDEWEKHKATIIDLYCERGLPLMQGKNTQDEHGCVYWIMKHRHGFAASKSQYEAQLKLWGATKNLKQSEWVSLLSEYNRLEVQGKDARIVISGQVQDGEKIRKARRRYLKRAPELPTTASLADAIAPERHSFVEVKQNGQWIRYRSENNSDRSDALVPTFNASQHGDESHRGAESMIPEASASFSEHQLILHGEPDTMFPSLAMDMLSVDYDPGNQGSMSPSRLCYTANTSGSGPGPQLDRPTFTEELVSFDFNIESQSTGPRFVQTDMQNGDGSPSASTHYDHFDHRDTANALYPSSLDALTDPQMTLDLALQGKSNATSLPNSTGALEIRDTTDRFKSLLSDTSIFWDTRHSKILVRPGSVDDPFLFNTLLYSIINGFAGAEDVPPTSVLTVLRENRGFFSHLSQLLRSGPDFVAKPIVDNLFPVAIKAGDAEAVALLLQATRNHPGISMDLNKTVLRISGGVYTPLELAMWSGSTEIVRLILEAGADPNRKINNKGIDANNVLSLAFSTNSFRSKLSISEVVRMLLDHGAEIDAESIDQAVQIAANNPVILEELVHRLPASKHTICFSPSFGRFQSIHDQSMYFSPQTVSTALIEDMILSLDKTVAISAVEDLVGKCMSTNCKKCILDNPKVISSMLLHAARRGNLELVAFLAQHCPASLHGALVGAVRSGNSPLIDFLIAKGARADGPAVWFRPESMLANIWEPTTSLAEAIRREDEQLVHTLADYGAWRRLDDKHHLNAAIIAAAEVGSIRYLEAVLRRNTPTKGPPLIALKMALERRNVGCALALLRAGTSVGDSETVLLALKMRNKDLVHVILDCAVHNNLQSPPGSHNELSAMELAAQWGDTEIIEAIASVGTNLNTGRHTTALTTAVKSRNRPLVDLLLDLGADPGAKALSGCSPLSEAVRNKDHSMIDHLLSKGATPADTAAFVEAAKFDQTALTKLCLAVKRKKTFEIKRFGGELMASAIRENNVALVSFWLDLKIDPATMVQQNLILQYGSNFHLRPNIEDRISLLGFAIKLAKDDDLQVVDLLLRSGTPADAIAARNMEYEGGKHIPFAKTPLLLAITKRNRKVINLLLKNGANINHPAHRGVFCTPLQEACKMGNYELVELLLQAGADIHSPAARRYGGTALQFAARSGSLKIVELLLLNKADPHAPGSEFGLGGTAFEFAAEYGRYHVLLLLWKTSPPEGFTAEILHSARDRAERNGHRGCFDFLENIIRDASFEQLILEGL